jgi:protein-S-isoprenylcysteine O-methyltransferase Ste14
MTRHAALAWDALLCGVFFVQHSWMVRKPFRAWLGRFIPAHWHGATYTAASAAALLLLTGLWQRSGVEIADVQGYAGWTIRAVFLGGMAVFAWGVRALRSFDLFGVEALRGRQLQAGGLAVTGPYRWVRHPFYASAIVMIWACPLLTLDRLLFDVLWTCWIAAGARLEERDLVAGFGDAYRAYRRDVPMLAPWHRPR